MKTQNAATKTVVGQFVVGKVNASVVLRVVDFDADYTLMFSTALSEAMTGKTVGIAPRTPVNKKANIAEAEELVAKLTAEATKTKTKGAVKKMENKQQFADRDAWASAQDNTTGNGEHHVHDRAIRNSNVGRFQSHAVTVAEQRFMDLGEYPVVVTGIEWFERKDRYNRVGAMYVQLPEGYADVRFYDRVEKKSFWYDFCDFAINQFKQEFNPADGSGDLTLAIREGRDGQLYVNLPKSEYNGDYYDRLKVRDIRFGMPHSDNNRNLEAALTAYLRFYAGEFVQANPANRHGIDEHCGACKFNMYVPGYDGLDETEEGFKNTLNTSDTIEMVQWGNEIPRRFCMVNRELVDMEVVKEVNEAMASENTTYYDIEGNLRYVGPNEVLMGGKAVNRYVALKQGTMDRCSGCAFYHNNAVKTDKQVSKEKAEGKEYVSKYWSEDARADRMPIQTLINNGKHEEWVNAFPGEVDGALDFRVYGIGGVNVYGSEEVAQAAIDGGVLTFVAETEAENEIETRAARVVEIVHQTCNRFGEVKDETLNRVLGLIEAKPEGISPRMEKRWDGAVARLAATITEYQGK